MQKSEHRPASQSGKESHVHRQGAEASEKHHHARNHPQQVQDRKRRPLRGLPASEKKVFRLQRLQKAVGLHAGSIHLQRS